MVRMFTLSKKWSHWRQTLWGSMLTRTAKFWEMSFGKMSFKGITYLHWLGSTSVSLSTRQDHSIFYNPNVKNENLRAGRLIFAWKYFRKWHFSLILRGHIFAKPEETITMFLCFYEKFSPINWSNYDVSRRHIFANLGQNS